MCILLADPVLHTHVRIRFLTFLRQRKKEKDIIIIKIAITDRIESMISIDIYAILAYRALLI